MNSLYESYVRKDALPTLFCPGCGNGTVGMAALRAIDSLGIREKTGFVSGIGCSSWIPCYFNMDVMHTIHGRALAFATGLKLAQPDKNIMVFTGDGDCLAIGGNHFLHAASRNIDLTVVMINNYVYGMTGGQKSPTTPMEAVTKTSPFGSMDYPLDGCALAVTLGAAYVARWTTAHPVQLEKSIKEGIETKGFSYIEVLAQCPTQGGRNVYGEKEPAAILKKYRDMAKEGTIKLGVFKKESERKEYGERLSEMLASKGLGE